MIKVPPHHLYIHVPFCERKCPYCAFHSSAEKPDWDKYAADIIAAISESPGCEVPTIFFGGGTPSLMPAATLEKILNAAHKHFTVSPDAEITIEMNPGTLEFPSREGVADLSAEAQRAKGEGRGGNQLSDYKSLGITRISVGAQSFNDGELRFLGRIHDAKQARETITAAQNAGFETSADFIYALPGQTVADVEKLCREIKSMGLTHASLYELTLEPGNKLPPCGGVGDEVAGGGSKTEMWLSIGHILNRYEVSNYAQPGHECKHNSGIWAGEPYIGLGPSAAGRIFDGTNWYEQYTPPSSLLPSSFVLLPSHDRAVEKVITGLRTKRGVRLSPDVLEILNSPLAGKSKKRELFRWGVDSLALSDSGLLILDSLLPDMIK
ncbi:MAG: coproporphyrinogen III oxidase family protein [Rickettsiales bacterium]|jgi:oxygen-independent coproporphyrinogen-3 oxidase|nr:coproporphyrinogen III oxidase family protein [Rickettsiales bacterium]